MPFFPFGSSSSLPLSHPLAQPRMNPFEDETTILLAPAVLPVTLYLCSETMPDHQAEKYCTDPVLPFGAGLPAGTYIMRVGSAGGPLLRLVKTA